MGRGSKLLVDKSRGPGWLSGFGGIRGSEGMMVGAGLIPGMKRKVRLPTLEETERIVR